MGGFPKGLGRVKVGPGLLGWLLSWDSGALLREHQVWVAGWREAQEHRTKEAKAGRLWGAWKVT